MIEFTQQELHKATSEYQENRDQIVSRAEASVVEWKYASAEMFGMFPLFEAIEFRGSNWWPHAERQWLREKGSGEWHLHGLDAKGNVRIIKSFNKIVTVFLLRGEIVDEVQYGGARPLTRNILTDGRVQAAYEYSLRPHQYQLERFEYAGDRCVRSVEQSWYESDGKWVEASWTTTCEFEYDDAGLRRVYRNMGEGLGGRALVYVRPESTPTCAPEATARRPLVAHKLEIWDEDQPWESVYSHAYGLEMSIDSDWRIDTVLLAPPNAIASITQDTGVTSMGTVYGGAAFMPSDGDLAPIVAEGAKWLLLDATHSDLPTELRAAWNAGLNVIVIVEEPRQITEVICVANNESPERLAVAIKPPAAPTSQWARKIAGEARHELRGLGKGDSRILIAANLTKDNLMDFLSLDDIDGVLLSDGDMSRTLEILIPLALAIQGGRWKRQE